MKSDLESRDFLLKSLTQNEFTPDSVTPELLQLLNSARVTRGCKIHNSHAAFVHEDARYPRRSDR
jgi:hypothetical protein